MKQRQRSQLVCVVLGLMMLGSGSVTFVSGHLHYSNYYWYASVFAPFAILIGILCLVAAFKVRKDWP
jgi:uncharacterized membrane protein HdeD (DUF308 family)